LHRKKEITGLVLALTAVGVMRAAAQSPPPKYDPASVERGQKTFVATCGFCHGTHAKGGEKGPDLLRSVLVLDDENGKSIGQMILKGRPDKGMPRFAMTPEQISDIANFLHNSISAAAQRDTYKILNIVTGNAKAGQAYFDGAGKCNSCHSVTGDLKGIGSKYEPVSLQDKFLMPRDRWSQGSSGPSTQNKSAVTVTVTLASGESFSGNLVYIDDFNVALRDASGNYHSFARKKDTPRVEMHNPLKVHSDMLMQYTDRDIHNLTAYLVTLK
jgi:cytochrome c oxidase cbb3-type subunit III